jgi:hypothetical protein
MSQWHGGKGGTRRRALVSPAKVSSNWDDIFKKKPIVEDETICYCIKCRKAAKINQPRMVVCPTCGNKRCPNASDHELECTNSNESGQAGSVYSKA